MKWVFGVLIFIAVLMNASRLNAGRAAWDNQFQSGRFEGSLGAGFFLSPFITHLKLPAVDYTLDELQLGYMLTDIHGPGVLRGNLEGIGEAFGGAIFRGQGNFVSGGTFWLRYNFVPSDCRFVPYAQLGGGVADTDLDRRIEGENFNFNLGIGAGVRWFLAPRCAVDLECRYQHISNGGLSRRNVGINACGPVLSFSYFF